MSTGTIIAFGILFTILFVLLFLSWVLKRMQNDSAAEQPMASDTPQKNEEI